MGGGRTSACRGLCKPDRHAVSPMLLKYRPPSRGFCFTSGTSATLAASEPLHLPCNDSHDCNTLGHLAVHTLRAEGEGSVVGPPPCPGVPFSPSYSHCYIEYAHFHVVGLAHQQDRSTFSPSPLSLILRDPASGQWSGCGVRRPPPGSPSRRLLTWWLQLLPQGRRAAAAWPAQTQSPPGTPTRRRRTRHR